MTLALFDFDGTLTNKDTLFEFVKFSKGSKSFYLGMLQLSPILIAHKLGFKSAKLTKEKFLSHFFGNLSAETFKEIGEKFCNQKLPEILNPRAMQKFQNYLDNADEVAIVTASIKDWIIPYFSDKKVKIITTEIIFSPRKKSIQISGKNCNGLEKVSRIKAEYNLNNFKNIHAYGNSKGDLPMLDLATHKFYNVF